MINAASKTRHAFPTSAPRLAHCFAHIDLPSRLCVLTHAGAFVYDVEEDKLNEAGVRAAVWDEMTFYHPEALNMKRL